MRTTNPVGSEVEGPRPDPTVVLENDRLALTVDSTTGAVLGLRSKTTGTEHLSRSEPAEVFRIVMPLRHRVSGWFADPFGHAFDSSAQRAAISLDRSGAMQTLTASYLELESEPGCFPVALTYQATLSDGGDEIELRLSIRNDASEVIREVHFPWLAGFGPNTLLVCPNVIRWLRDLFPVEQEGNWEEHPVLTLGTSGRAPYWPGVGGLSMPWVDLGDCREGLYLASLDRDGNAHSFILRDTVSEEALRVSLSLGFLLHLPPGGDWRSPAVILCRTRETGMLPPTSIDGASATGTRDQRPRKHSGARSAPSRSASLGATTV